MTKHVAVLIDDLGSQHSSGKSCAAALRLTGYRVTEVQAGPDLVRQLSDLKPDVAFNAVESRFGLNGTLQGVLEFLRLPYTHSGVLASALAIDKHQTKIVLKAAGVPVTDHFIASRAEVARSHVMAAPYVIKPIVGRSRVGVFLVTADQTHPPQELLGEAWDGGEEVMVERYIAGRDLACAVMGDVAIGVTEIITEPRNSENVHATGTLHQIIPAQIQPKIYDKVQKMSLKAHAALGCRGVTRTDFRFNDQAGEDGELVCLGLSTQPGMTQSSLAPEQARHAGHSFEELVAWMVEDASCNR